jgi:hypothetical protein
MPRNGRTESVKVLVECYASTKKILKLARTERWLRNLIVRM